ncbi:2OG-Fe(II) oxygenase family protein [Aurantibacter sp.]|uniref:2OG-Fe(II) oxygenase family protein n=1 Tax=Aurantibacter sp. TaxID=2807103 RepID=UPI0035C7AF08
MIKNDIFNFNTEAFSTKNLISAFKLFLEKPLDYRIQFLQAKYNKAFDGYSFLGQENSLNQYSTDQLHSFVLSEFTSVENFPREFHSYLKTEFLEVKKAVTNLELEVLKSFNNNEFIEIYKSNFRHMISCNYYPKIVDKTITERLSTHKDVSLFSVFPYGLDNGLAYQNSNNRVVDLGFKPEAFGFKGFGVEYFLDEKLKGLNHKVNLDVSENNERFSIAFFSIPKPNTTFTFRGKIYNSETFYINYLNLF